MHTVTAAAARQYLTLEPGGNDLAWACQVDAAHQMQSVVTNDGLKRSKVTLHEINLERVVFKKVS